MTSWKAKIEYSVVGIAAFSSFFLLIQPALVALHPMFTNKIPTQVALVVTVVAFSVVYALAIEYIREGDHWYLFFDNY